MKVFREYLCTHFTPIVTHSPALLTITFLNRYNDAIHEETVFRIPTPEILRMYRRYKTNIFAYPFVLYNTIETFGIDYIKRNSARIQRIQDLDA
jgi:hypothetical protein